MRVWIIRVVALGLSTAAIAAAITGSAGAEPKGGQGKPKPSASASPSPAPSESPTSKSESRISGVGKSYRNSSLVNCVFFCWGADVRGSLVSAGPTDTGSGIASVPVYVNGEATVTDAEGNWEISFCCLSVNPLVWTADFPGNETHHGSTTAGVFTS